LLIYSLTIAQVDISENPSYISFVFRTNRLQGVIQDRCACSFYNNFYITRNAFKQVFRKAAPDVVEQRAAFLAFFQDNSEVVRSAVMQKIPTLASVAAKLRCINVPARLPAAQAAADAASAAAANEPLKAEMNDNLHARVVLFMVYGGIDPDLADLFKRYYGNEQSSVRGVLF
jgi:hypothetical protein